MHRTVNNVLRTLVQTNPPRIMTQARDIIDDALATAMHAMQTTVATTLGSKPGVGGPVKKMLFFQMVPKSFLSVLIHSTRCKYDSLDFFIQNF
jgi:hypothetical protein